MVVIPARFRHFLFAGLTILILLSNAFGQNAASLRGILTDARGQRFHGTSVQLENIDTGAQRRTVTDEFGAFHFVQIAPGRYRLTAERAQTGKAAEVVELFVGTASTRNLKLRTEELKESFCRECFPGINAVNGAIQNVIISHQVRSIPQEGREITNFFSLHPGVPHTGILDKLRPDTRAVSVAGARSDQIQITLDGIIVNDQQTGEPRSTLPATLDSVREMMMMTANAPADIGRSSGGYIALVTRNGSNQLHGSVYEYHRNTIATANSFFNNSMIDPLTGRSLERPKLLRNVFGGTLDGPILKNRAFFFFNFEDTVLRAEEPQLRMVPSETMRAGILHYRDTTGAVRTVTPAGLTAMDPLNLGPNPAILSLLSQYPAGNDPLAGSDGGLNVAGYRFNAPQRSEKPSFTLRLDFTSPDRKHDVFVRGSLARYREDDAAAQFPGQTAARELLTHNRGVALGHTWTISRNLTSAMRWGITLQDVEFTGASQASGFELRGLDTLQNFSTRNGARRNPTTNFTEDLTWTDRGHTLQVGVNYRGIANRQSSEDRTFPFHHSNLGFMQAFGMNVLPPDIAPAAKTSYVAAQMALLGVVNQTEVTYFTDRTGTVLPLQQAPHRDFITHEFEAYAQHEWRLERGLTLTAGLRYSYYAPPYEKNGNQVRAGLDIRSWFENRRSGALDGIPSNANPLLSFVPAGKANGGPPIFDPDRNNLAPRFSMAWAPSFSAAPLRVLFGERGESSVRGGVSVLYDRMGGMMPVTADRAGAVGLATAAQIPAATYNYTTAPRFAGLDNLGAVPLPPAPAAGFPSVPGLTHNTGFMVDNRLRTPYSTTFAFSFSRSLPVGLTVEASYVGRIARNLLVQADYAAPLTNFKDPVSGETWVQASGRVADLLAANTLTVNVPAIPFIENVFAPLAGGGLTASQAFYDRAATAAPSWMDLLMELDAAPGGSTIHGPYTFFQQQFDWLPVWTNLGRSSYHSLQFSVRGRVMPSLRVDFNYTLAKSKDNGSAVESEGQGAGQLVNAFAPDQSWGASSFDVRHLINANFTLDLPNAKSRCCRFTHIPAIGRVLSGWSLTGVIRWHTGYPFAATSGNGFYFPTNFFVNGPPTLKADAALPVTAVTRDAVGGPNIFPDALAALNAFENTRSGFSGNRNILYGPGYFTLDTNIQKTIQMDRGQIEFRVETFNLTNTVNFDGRVNPLGTNGIAFDLSSPASFGRLRSLAGSPRVMQFALRYKF